MSKMIKNMTFEQAYSASKKILPKAENCISKCLYKRIETLDNNISRLRGWSSSSKIKELSDYRKEMYSIMLQIKVIESMCSNKELVEFIKLFILLEQKADSIIAEQRNIRSQITYHELVSANDYEDMKDLSDIDFIKSLVERVESTTNYIEMHIQTTRFEKEIAKKIDEKYNELSSIVQQVVFLNQNCIELTEENKKFYMRAINEKCNEYTALINKVA